MLMTRRIRFGLVCLASSASLTLVGCASNEDYSTLAAAEIRDNATPELDTLYQRRVDMDNAIAVTNDENGRMFNQDMGRFWLLDRPSRLSPDAFRR
jgi:ABC-type oligopeptide transport system substrate-binding subunit